MDDLDRKILTLLAKNARMPYSSEDRTNPLLPSKSVLDLIIRKHDRPL